LARQRFSDHFLDEADPQSLMNYVRRLKTLVQQQGQSFVNINIYDILPDVITNIINAGSTGDVVGPASAVNGNIAVFDGATGKLIKSDNNINWDTSSLILTLTGSGATIRATDGMAIEGKEKTDENAGGVTLASGGVIGTGDAGDLSIRAGSTGTGYGGRLFIESGSASTDGSGGDITITPGTGSGAGIDGKVQIVGDVNLPAGHTYQVDGTPIGGSGDMLASTYDPDGVAADIFDPNNTPTKTGLADGAYSGDSETGVAGAALSFGHLVYLASDSRWEKVSASAYATCHQRFGICVLAAAGDGSATRILSRGNVRADSVYPSMTVGADMYADTTAGLITGSQPQSNAGEIIRLVGHANTAHELHFDPSGNYYEIG
jgi:hypothetical protein